MGWPGRALAQYPEVGLSSDDQGCALAGFTDGEASSPISRTITKLNSLPISVSQPLRLPHNNGHPRSFACCRSAARTSTCVHCARRRAGGCVTQNPARAPTACDARPAAPSRLCVVESYAADLLSAANVLL